MTTLLDPITFFNKYFVSTDGYVGNLCSRNSGVNYYQLNCNVALKKTDNIHQDLFYDTDTSTYIRQNAIIQIDNTLNISIFDGTDHTIDLGDMNPNYKLFIGLFGQLGNTNNIQTIRNIIIGNSTPDIPISISNNGDYGCGILLTSNVAVFTFITNCHINSDIDSVLSKYGCGGFIGSYFSGLVFIEICSINGDVTINTNDNIGDYGGGGFVGCGLSGFISVLNSYIEGNIIANNGGGGFIGCGTYTNIQSIYSINTCRINGNISVTGGGGFIGSGHVADCYIYDSYISCGNLIADASDYIPGGGGFIGPGFSGNIGIYDSYLDITASMSANGKNFTNGGGGGFIGSYFNYFGESLPNITIENCYIKCDDITLNYGGGGFIGSRIFGCNQISIAYSHITGNDATISVFNPVDSSGGGGLIGGFCNGNTIDIDNCQIIANIVAYGFNGGGGFIGANCTASIEINNSYINGDIQADGSDGGGGGFVGSVWYDNITINDQIFMVLLILLQMVADL